jgi:dihydroneopterin aldolase
MKTVQSSISLRDMRFYAYHGVFPQERTVGGDYAVDLRVELDISAAVEHDMVEVTSNYAELYDVVKAEMLQPSDLLETVAARIGTHVLNDFPRVMEVTVSVVKLNPPMGADCKGAGVEIKMVR